MPSNDLKIDVVAEPASVTHAAKNTPCAYFNDLNVIGCPRLVNIVSLLYQNSPEKLYAGVPLLVNATNLPFPYATLIQSLDAGVILIVEAFQIIPSTEIATASLELATAKNLPAP